MNVRDCNVIGHNGTSVRNLWLYRIRALCDGARGATMAVIAGSVSNGAYSTVLSDESVSQHRVLY